MRTLYWFAVIKAARGLARIHPPSANWFGEKTGLVAALEGILRGG